MEIRRELIYGSLLEQNNISADKAFISIPGSFKGSNEKLNLDEDTLSRQLLLIGGTGSGKSNVFYHIIGQTRAKMTADDAMIIFDTKGDYFNLFHRPGDPVIGNSGAYRDISGRWNVFREILSDGWNWDKIESNTRELSWSVFRKSIDNSKDAFFPNAARDLFAAILICMLEAGENDIDYKKKRFNNSELKRAFDTSSIDEMIELLKDHPSCKSVLSYIGDGQNSQGLGVYAELLAGIRGVFNGVFADKGNFSVRNFVSERGGKVLFIEYDLALGNSLGPVYSLIFDLALKEALGRSGGRGSVYLICDEFKLLPGLQHIEDGVNFGRGLGVKIMAGLQSVNQLTEVYGEARGKNIAAGFSSVFAFRANDPDTRKFITDLYGKNMIIERRRTLSNTFAEERRVANVVEDWDITDLSVGEAIIGTPFSKPFKFKFDLYC